MPGTFSLNGFTEWFSGLHIICQNNMAPAPKKPRQTLLSKFFSSPAQLSEQGKGKGVFCIYFIQITCGIGNRSIFCNFSVRNRLWRSLVLPPTIFYRPSTSKLIDSPAIFLLCQKAEILLVNALQDLSYLDFLIN